MPAFRDYLRENRATLSLASPIMAGLVAQMLMGWADSIMVGRLGIVPLGACALANTILSLFLVFGFGLMSSVAVKASHAFGAGQPRESGAVFHAGLMLACLAGTSIGVVVQLGSGIVHFLGQPAELTSEVRPYLCLVGWSVLPLLVSVAGKQFSEALLKPWQPFWIMMGGVLANVFFNWLFIYGNWGFPALGLEGAGVATLLARMASALALLGYIRKAREYRFALPESLRTGMSMERLGSLLRLGLPVGAQHLFEVGAFATASLMLGWIGVKALAAHQIAITCAATTFMLPLGLSLAVTVRVGQARGALEFLRVRTIVFGAIGLGMTIMSFAALIFLLKGRAIASVFVTDVEALELAAKLLTIAGLFQVFDGIQVVSMGGLRGMEDVRVPTGLSFTTYWLIALPMAAWLAFPGGRGAVGVWAGMAVGLATAAGMLSFRFWMKTRAGVQAGAVVASAV